MLGKAIAGRRDKVIVSTKATFRMGDGPNDVGSSRHHLRASVEGSLKRLGTDYIDLFQLHGFDALTPVEETLYTLDELVREGKIRYLGVSNFSGWHLMKSLSPSEKHSLQRYVAHQAYYSLVGRDYEWELMPLAPRPGRVGRGLEPAGLGPAHRQDPARHGHPGAEPPARRRPTWDRRWTTSTCSRSSTRCVAVGEETGKSVPQVALNWLLQRPTVANVIVGARDEKQLRENLGAVGWNLTADQVKRLDDASAVTCPIRTGTRTASASATRRRCDRPPSRWRASRGRATARPAGASVEGASVEPDGRDAVAVHAVDGDRLDDVVVQADDAARGRPPCCPTPSAPRPSRAGRAG